MKKAKSLLALLLSALLLIGVLAGCASEPSTAPADDTGTDTSEPSTAAPDTESGTNTEPDADSTEPEQTEPDVEPDAEPAYMGTILYSGHEVQNFPIVPANEGSGGLTLPLADGDELSVFCSFSSTRLSSPAEILANQVLEEKTGVTIDWQTYTEADQFSIMIASGMYADIIMVSKTTYTGGIDKAIDEEIYVPANNYFDYTPNFVNMLSADSSIDIQSKTDVGNYWFSCIQTGNEPAWCGPMMRTDWLDKVNMDIPQTYDDWYNMLVAFRDELGSTGMIPSSAGYDSTGFGLIAGYDTMAGFYAKDGVEARYGYLDEGMREYITMMSEWYAEGLLNKDFPSINTWTFGSDYIAAEECGVLEFSMYSLKPMIEAMVPGDDVSFDAVPYPAKTADRQGDLHFRRYNFIIGDASSFITTGAVDRGTDILAAQWLDYRYSKDGFAIVNYGREGETWEYGEDGMPHVTDFVLNPTDGRLTSEVMDDTQFSKTGGAFYSWLHAYDQYPDNVSIAYDIWDGSSKGDWIMPGVTLTTEESEAYSDVYGDIQTYANEMTLRFITGEIPMTDWDNFVAEIESMGIQTAIDAYQAALDRYNAR